MAPTGIVLFAAFVSDNTGIIIEATTKQMYCKNIVWHNIFYLPLKSETIQKNIKKILKIITNL